MNTQAKIPNSAINMHLPSSFAWNFRFLLFLCDIFLFSSSRSELCVSLLFYIKIDARNEDTTTLNHFSVKYFRQSIFLFDHFWTFFLRLYLFFLWIVVAKETMWTKFISKSCFVPYLFIKIPQFLITISSRSLEQWTRINLVLVYSETIISINQEQMYLVEHDHWRKQRIFDVVFLSSFDTRYECHFTVLEFRSESIESGRWKCFRWKGFV